MQSRHSQHRHTRQQSLLHQQQPIIRLIPKRRKPPPRTSHPRINFRRHIRNRQRLHKTRIRQRTPDLTQKRTDPKPQSKIPRRTANPRRRSKKKTPQRLMPQPRQTRPRQNRTQRMTHNNIIPPPNPPTDKLLIPQNTIPPPLKSNRIPKKMRTNPNRPQPQPQKNHRQRRTPHTMNQNRIHKTTSTPKL